jgi:hypothetical protein
LDAVFATVFAAGFAAALVALLAVAFTPVFTAVFTAGRAACFAALGAGFFATGATARLATRAIVLTAVATMPAGFRVAFFAFAIDSPNDTGPRFSAIRKIESRFLIRHDL